MVEAKNENMMSWLGQCIAEMIAAQLFNEREGKPLPVIYRAVTTGILWKFLKLMDKQVYIDLKDYGITDNPGKIIGILSSMMKQGA